MRRCRFAVEALEARCLLSAAGPMLHGLYSGSEIVAPEGQPDWLADPGANLSGDQVARTSTAMSPFLGLATLAVLPDGDFQYVIVTSSTLVGAFQPLLDHKLSKGLTGAIVTTESIYAEYSGTESHDNADKIRHFIADAHVNHGTQWVLLGGDVEVIPIRGVYASNTSLTNPSLPTDLYYAALDGPWNSDGDNLWGESQDGLNGWDVDLEPDVAVGRVPASNATEVGYFVAKTILYETTTAPNNKKAVFLGEKIDDRTYGSVSAVGIRDAALPDDWLPALVEHYDTSTFSWNKADLINDLNASPHFVESMGHSSPSLDSRLAVADINALSNSFPYLMYSQGCDPGALDVLDLSVAEAHVLAEHGALAVVMNTREGWYLPGSLAAYSHFYALEFWKAILQDGQSRLGEAFNASRLNNLWRVGLAGTYRWVHFTTTLFGDPETPLQVDPPPPPASIVGRHVFYNQSKFDGNTSGVSSSDDSAIAPNKSAYLPGSGAATFSNVTSYSRGINGVMVDIAGAHSLLTGADFFFRMSTQVSANNTPSAWESAPEPATISVRVGAGASGSDRVEIIWPNGAIANRWLEVTVAGDDDVGGFNTNTGLDASDIFYFGNRIGDTGSGTPTLAITSALDEIATRGNAGAGATITNAFDFDRSGLVTAVDNLIARNNSGTLTKINISDPPASPQGALAPSWGGVALDLNVDEATATALQAATHPLVAGEPPARHKVPRANPASTDIDIVGAVMLASSEPWAARAAVDEALIEELLSGLGLE